MKRINMDALQQVNAEINDLLGCMTDLAPRDEDLAVECLNELLAQQHDILQGR